MKRLVSFFILVTIFISGCSQENVDVQGSDKIKVVATLFPQYDFAKRVAKDKADVKLLLPPGTESHTYEPTPSDIINLNSSRVFIYTGKYMEPWSDKIVSGANLEKLKILDVSNGISLIKEDHHEIHDDNVHDNHDHDDSEHDHSHEKKRHSHEFDPHIWLDPLLACHMVDNIKDMFCEIDKVNRDFYEKNAEDYKQQILSLDKDFKDAIESGKRKTLVFGGRFAHIYFIKRYGLKYESAFDSCSTEMEPSVKKVAHIIDFISENKIPCIYYEELSEPKVAMSISEQTGVKTLKFSTAHNLSKDQLEKGISYIEIMRENLQNLRYGLN